MVQLTRSPLILSLVLGLLPLGAGVAPGQAEDESPRLRKLRKLFFQPAISAKITAIANEIDLAVISVGKENGVKEGDDCFVWLGSELAIEMVISRADQKWSACKVMNRRDKLRVGAVALVGGQLKAEEKGKLLDHVFSFHPLTPEERRRVGAVLPLLDSDDIRVREKADQELLGMGSVAAVALRALDPNALSAESRARIQDVLWKLDAFDRLLQSSGLEHDLEFLALLEDPRAFERLKRILSQVEPFRSTGLPKRDSGLAEALGGWWSREKDRVRWNPLKDCFER